MSSILSNITKEDLLMMHDVIKEYRDDTWLF